MLVKFEQNRIVQTTRNYEFFDKKKAFFRPFWQSFEVLKDISVAETNL